MGRAVIGMASTISLVVGRPARVRLSDPTLSSQLIIRTVELYLGLLRTAFTICCCSVGQPPSPDSQVGVQDQ